MELETLIETEGEEEIQKAAKFIQNKFRTYLKRKSQSELIPTSLDLSTCTLQEPTSNGTNGHSNAYDDSGVSVSSA